MQPLVIGIAGGSGSGKTTVAERVQRALVEPEANDGGRAPEPVGAVLLEHDAYYRDRLDLTYEERCLLNFDHPDALETELLVHHLTELREGRAVDVPVYDFTAHRRSPTARRVTPQPVIVVEGILVFVDEALRNQLDIRIYVDTDADIRAFRRIRRDLEHRGRSFESVREQYYKTVRPMHLQFVEPSKRWADIILPEGGDNRIGIELVCALVQKAKATGATGRMPRS